MRIRVTSLLVDDQEQARHFYTEKLGFVIKQDMPLGEFRWLTVASEEDEGLELLLEPTNFPPARVFQQELFRAGIAAASFNVDDVRSTVEQLRDLGVEIVAEPTRMGPATVATINDTCGNLIQVYELA